MKFLTKQAYRFKIVVKYLAKDIMEVMNVLINDFRIYEYMTTKNKSTNKEIELSFKWETDQIKPTKQKKRDHLYLQIEFNDSYKLVIPLQAKFYAEKSSHLNWGRQLKAITIEATRNQEPSIQNDLWNTDYFITSIDFMAAN